MYLMCRIKMCASTRVNLSSLFVYLLGGFFCCCFFAISAAVFGGTDAVSQTSETTEVNYELSSLSEKSCAAEVSCCLSDISPVCGQSSAAVLSPR